MTIPAWALGLPATGILVYRLASTVNAILEHANIRLWRPLDRAGSLVWCTPNMYKVLGETEVEEPRSFFALLVHPFRAERLEPQHAGMARPSP